jgi:transcription elongation factor Elf1
VKTQTKTLNAAPGFLCPVCRRVHIQIALETFLTSTAVVCPSCGQSFAMDKSGCGPMIEMLQNLQTSQKNLETLTKREF